MIEKVKPFTWEERNQTVWQRIRDALHATGMPLSDSEEKATVLLPYVCREREDARGNRRVWSAR